MLPEGFKNNMMSLLGETEYKLLEDSFSDAPVQSLRLNPFKGNEESRRKLIELLGLEKIPYERDGYYFSSDVYPGRRPYHEAGAYYIQDPGAMVPGAMLAESLSEHFGSGEDDLRILDLCAAPGGKSTQIASYMNGRGILFSNEINRSRAEILSGNIERMGIANAVVLNESSEKLLERFSGYFDAIIVDAPCSGEGMFRKDHGAIEEWSEESVDVCADRQSEILENAYRMLRPGGVMIYSTCTFEKKEDEDVVGRLIAGHPDVKLTEPSAFRQKAEGVCRGVSGYGECVRIWPMHFKGEGHFAALLEKSGDGERSLPVGGFEDNSRIRDIRILEAFLEETLSNDALKKIMGYTDRFRLFGDNLFIMPEETPSLKGLKVLRCGLQIGSFKKDRFEPAHALAHFLDECDVKNVKKVTEDEAEEFVRGMTLEGEGKGWTLISLDGYSLGWGKASGGRIKNHYPKGLRIPG